MISYLETWKIEGGSVIFKDFVMNSFSFLYLWKVNLEKNYRLVNNEPENVYQAFIFGLFYNINDRYDLKSNQRKWFRKIWYYDNKKKN